MIHFLKLISEIKCSFLSTEKMLNFEKVLERFLFSFLFFPAFCGTNMTREIIKEKLQAVCLDPYPLMVSSLSFI